MHFYNSEKIQFEIPCSLQISIQIFIRAKKKNEMQVKHAILHISSSVTDRSFLNLNIPVSRLQIRSRIYKSTSLTLESPI